MKQLTIQSFLVFLLLNIFTGVNAQELTAKWSNKIQQKNAQDGFFNYFLGENDKYLYAYFKKKGNKERYKIVSFDKKTMKRKSAAEVIGYPSTAAEERNYKNFSYYKTIVYDNAIYTFFKASDRKSNKILVKVFSPELKLQKKLTLVTSQPTKKQRKNKEAFPFIIGNSHLKKVLIGVEKETEPFSNIKLEYKVLNEDFSFSAASQITLPIEYNTIGIFKVSVDGLACSYSFGNDGNLHFRTTIGPIKRKSSVLNDEFYNKRILEDKSSYPLLGTINLKNNEIYTVPIKAEGKRLVSTYRLITKNDTRIYGYFSDLSKSKHGREMHGLYYATLNEKYELENLSFSYFDKKLIREMFKNDQNDKDGGRKGGCCLIGKKGSTHAEDGTMNTEYEIEQAFASSDGSVYLFTSIMHNYSTRSCSTDPNTGQETCTIRYYCNKENVTIFKLNKDGEIEWGSNYDRFMKYTGWYIYDIEVIFDDNGFYVTYGSRNNAKAIKYWFQFWKKVDYTNPFEYIYVNDDNGKIDRKVLKVNKPNTPQSEAKHIDPLEITVIDNKFYVNSSTTFISPTGIPIYCLGGCMIPSLMNGSYRANSYFGVLEPASK